MPRSKHRRGGKTRPHTKPPKRGGGHSNTFKSYYDPGARPQPSAPPAVRAARIERRAARSR